MAWFHICVANHHETGRSSLTDQIEWVSAGLLEAGHRVSMALQQLEPAAINLIWECFHPTFAEVLSQVEAVYGIVATEIPDGVGFNWREEALWRQRYEAFAIAASGASFIWVLVESALPYYAQFAPAAFLPLGFSERLIPSYIDEVPTTDFSFFGQRTLYREKAVETLRRYATVDWPVGFLPHHKVHEMIARSKIGLNFKQSPQWPVPSGPRLGRLMLAKRGVASEYLAEPTQQGEICGCCPRDADFVEYAMSLLASGWRERADTTFESYRRLMPMKDIIENVVGRTAVGIQPRCDIAAPITMPSIDPNSWSVDAEIVPTAQDCPQNEVRNATRFSRFVARFWR